MSADLFAEFDTGDSKPTQKSSQVSFGQASALGNSTQSTSAFGSFGQIQQQQSTPASGNFGQTQTSTWGVPHQNSASIPWPSLADASQTQIAAPVVASKGGNSDDDDDDDGWGDFETAAPAPAPAPAPAAQPAISQPATSNAMPRPLSTATSSQGRTAYGQNLPDMKPAQHAVPQRTRIVRADTMDLMTNNLLNTTTPPTQHQAQFSSNSIDWNQPAPAPIAAPKAVAKTSYPADPSVLFDADDFELGQGPDDEDDDFGDFETGTPLEKPAQDLLSLDILGVPVVGKPAELSLSSLNIADIGPSRPAPPRSPSYHERNPFPGLSVTTPPVEVTKKLEDNSESDPPTAWPSAGVGKRSPTLDDGWGAFEDFPPEPKTNAAAKPKAKTIQKPKQKPISITGKPKKPTPSQPTTSESNWDWGFKEETKQPATAPSTKLDASWDWDAAPVAQEEISKPNSSSDIPPVNIPPPSILMSILPMLLGQANRYLFQPSSSKNQSIKDRVMSDPKTIEFLRGYLTLARVAARIIAGRKSRWHRDKFLAQSMSISAAGSKGMKLAGVDKAQATRESREAGDVVDLWKENLGRLRSAAAAANASIKDTSLQLKIPELGENMHVSTAKDVPTAAKACIICGLKREERVAKVDGTVEDSFGEWWADHWGHVECKRFWLEHETELRQR